MAYNGMAYWSLATQGLVYVLMNTLIVWYFSPWRPTWKNINFSPLRSMFKFSFKILATSITTHVNNNILNIVLGHSGYLQPSLSMEFEVFYVGTKHGEPSGSAHAC